MQTSETQKINRKVKGAYFPTQVWKCVLDIADGVLRGMPHALIPLHTTAHLDTYMVKLSDDGRKILIIRDTGRLTRDGCERRITLLEDRLSQLSVGENPAIVDPNSRWYTKLVEQGKERMDKAAVLKKEIRALKDEIKSLEGLKVSEIGVDEFRERDFTLDFQELRF